MTGSFILFAAKDATVAPGLMGFGYLVVDFVAGRREQDVLSKWALSIRAVVGFAFVLMLLHIASSGRMLSNPWLVRAGTFARRQNAQIS